MGNEISSPTVGSHDKNAVKLNLQFVGSSYEDKCFLANEFFNKMNYTRKTFFHMPVVGYSKDTLSLSIPGNGNVIVRFCDYGHSDVYHGTAAITRSHFSLVDTVIVVFDSKSRNSFSFAKVVVKQLMELKRSCELPGGWMKAPSLWNENDHFYIHRVTKEITKQPPSGFVPPIDSAIVLVGNNSGEERERVVSVEAKVLAKEFLLPYYETRAGAKSLTTRENNLIIKAIYSGLVVSRKIKVDKTQNVNTKLLGKEDEPIVSMEEDEKNSLAMKKRSYSLGNHLSPKENECYRNSFCGTSYFDTIDENEWKMTNLFAYYRYKNEENHVVDTPISLIEEFKLSHSIIVKKNTGFLEPLENSCAHCRRNMFGHRISLSCQRCGKVVCRRKSCGESFSNTKISFCNSVKPSKDEVYENCLHPSVLTAISTFRSGLSHPKCRNSGFLKEWMMKFHHALSQIALPLREDENREQVLKDLGRESVIVDGDLIWANAGLLEQRILAMLVEKCSISNGYVGLRIAHQIMQACCRTIAGAESYRVLQLLFDHPEFDFRPDTTNLPAISVDVDQQEELSKAIVIIKIFSHFDIYQPNANLERSEEWLRIRMTIVEKLDFSTRTTSRVMYLSPQG